MVRKTFLAAFAWLLLASPCLILAQEASPGATPSVWMPGTYITEPLEWEGILESGGPEIAQLFGFVPDYEASLATLGQAFCQADEAQETIARRSNLGMPFEDIFTSLEEEFSGASTVAD